MADLKQFACAHRFNGSRYSDIDVRLWRKTDLAAFRLDVRF